jgi:hypothetical protein
MIYNADEKRKNDAALMHDGGISERGDQESPINTEDRGIPDKLAQDINIRMNINAGNGKSPLLGKKNILKRSGSDLRPIRTEEILARLPSIDENVSTSGMTVKRLQKIMNKAAASVALVVLPNTMREFSDTVLMYLRDYMDEKSPTQPKEVGIHSKMKFLGLRTADLPSVPDYLLMEHINDYSKGQKDPTYFEAFRFDG